MRKYFFGLMAIILALGAVAFTNPELAGVKQTHFDFYYTAPGGSFTQGNVSTNANWNITSIACNATNERACKMRVEAAYTKTVGSDRLLRVPGDAGSILSIQTLGSGSNYYVHTTTVGASNIVNKSIL